MGFTLPQVYRFVLLPMAYRIIIPPMTSEFLTIFKNSSTALTIGVLELTAQSRQISEYTFKTFEAFTAATLIYIVITLTVIYVMRWLESTRRGPGLHLAGRRRPLDGLRLERHLEEPRGPVGRDAAVAQALRDRARRRHLLRHAARDGAPVELEDPLLPGRGAS